MVSNNLTIQDLWAVIKPHPFKPNPNQEKAILHEEGPLFLTAGPGSGKTRGEHPLLADRPQTRSLGLYKLNPPARVSESPRRRPTLRVLQRSTFV
ncbi:UvrD-helicase domain-containing protein [Nostoc sp.]|uniref:UvrD-helicase domain-containing protein n=1 Tax=Nostoc sp. TaxID=1180 RepID=UPI003FA5C96E